MNLLILTGFLLAGTLPNPSLTPGAIDPGITQANIAQTICQRGYTRSVRPPVSYTEPLKKRQIRQYNDQDRRPWLYEEDHLIPLDIGGSPTSPQNLWPQPHLGPNQWGSYAKDRLEKRLGQLVCRHQISLAQAQSMVAANWITTYQRLIGPDPDNQPLRRWHEDSVP